MRKCCRSTLRQLQVELVLNSFLPARPPAAAQKGLTVALGWTYTAISDHPCDWSWEKCGGISGLGSKALVLRCTARQVEGWLLSWFWDQRQPAMKFWLSEIWVEHLTVGLLPRPKSANPNLQKWGRLHFILPRWRVCRWLRFSLSFHGAICT